MAHLTAVKQNKIAILLISLLHSLHTFSFPFEHVLQMTYKQLHIGFCTSTGIPFSTRKEDNENDEQN